MSNDEIALVLKSLQEFWLKWRDHVPCRDSQVWEKIERDAMQVLELHGRHLVFREVEGRMEEVEEPVTWPLVDWFLNRLSERSAGSC